MKATMRQSVYDRDLGFVREGETVEITVAQAKRIASLATIEGRPRGRSKAEKNETENGEHADSERGNKTF